MSDESYKSQPSGKPTCTRAIARQGTSYMAFRGEPLEPGDPLLGFRPVAHKRPRRNSIGPARQRAFIAALAASGIVTDAARHIGASKEALYKLRNWPGGEEFRGAWDAAIDRGVARLEDTALARAIAGEERMVVSCGKVLGSEVRHNENLVMFFLRNRRPERYGSSVRLQDLKPGHPAYERIRKEVLAEDEQTEEETRASLVRFLEDMRERRLANAEVLAEWGAEEDDGASPALPEPEAETSTGSAVDPASATTQTRSETMAQQGKRQGQPGGEDRQQNPQGGSAGQAGRDTGKSRQQNQEGQNQSAQPEGQGGRPEQQDDLAGMEGAAQQEQRGGQQGQPGEKSRGEGKHGGNR